MELMIADLGSDAALLLFSAAGLVATAVAIMLDTRTQKHAKAEVQFDR